ncbi:MAG TPA: GTPase Era [Geminicoccus sp.]|jgi:GTP-binding protein Era|uniref:GTPase Era n=1 Tax=Geminicoccus sp. TaxID=2024832 RepID=UPI002E3040AD|nr:GTPase Era [Geminicoccus sp.]HEX2526579.1 GTPase Era [Geminicoccus sp.]
MTDPSTESATRCGFVALAGAPNAGKSTLLNHLVGHKVSIVTPKAQTTRRRVIGITTVDESQVLFVDTPGIFAGAKRALERAMVQAAWDGVDDADLVLFVLDADKGLNAQARAVLEGLAGRQRRAWLVINKIDAVRRDKALPLIAEANKVVPFEETFIVSALKGDGCADLLAAVAKALPEGVWLYPEDQLSDLSDRALAAEITREKVFLQLQDELPYSITVETEQYLESEDGKEVRIDQVVYVLRDSQKAIVLGKGGTRIKAIGQAARQDLEKLLDARVHLFLFVKVREWTDDPERYREMGLDSRG